MIVYSFLFQQSLQGQGLSLATEYFTTEEMVSEQCLYSNTAASLYTFHILCQITPKLSRYVQIYTFSSMLLHVLCTVLFKSKKSDGFPIYLRE
jgi:hypothetical protein